MYHQKSKMDLTFKYRIIVIESLNENNDDSLTGSHLFQNVLQRLPSKFPNIVPSLYTVHSLEELQNTLDQINSVVNNDEIVLLHIEAHGSEEGITLYDGYTISWLDFYNLIRPINVKISNRLILNLALCEGISLLGNIDIHKRAPFSIAFFFSRKIYQNEVLRSMVQFYSFDNSPFELIESAKRVNEAIDPNDNNCVFGWITAEQQYDGTMNPDRDPVMFRKMIANNYSTFREKGITEKSFDDFVQEVKDKMVADGETYRSHYLFKDLDK